jgi:hypothetical protein
MEEYGTNVIICNFDPVYQNGEIKNFVVVVSGGGGGSTALGGLWPS